MAEFIPLKGGISKGALISMTEKLNRLLKQHAVEASVSPLSDEASWLRPSAVLPTTTTHQLQLSLNQVVERCN